ncbi:MAG: hypothetical protein FJ026_12340 [Chloroflexi bacterium]|nr:hypothetical protein [Chloroflexota bacterium]
MNTSPWPTSVEADTGYNRCARPKWPWTKHAITCGWPLRGAGCQGASTSTQPRCSPNWADSWVAGSSRRVLVSRLLTGGPRRKARRVLRGGAFNNEARNVRCAYRNRNNPNNHNRNIGFRVVASHVFPVSRKCRVG